MILVYSKTTGLLLGQLCANRTAQPAGTLCVLSGAGGAGAHYIDVRSDAVRLESVR